jgi:tetratricopeptide (TPR) repeat protein
MTPAASKRFWQLMEDGYALVQKSRYREALGRFEKARALASMSRDARLEDKAANNKSMALIEMGAYAEAARGLKETILRSRDNETICGAAYNLSISLRRQGHYQRAYFYARLASEKSRALKDLNWLARCHNLLGNLHLMQSRLEPALKEYRRALAIRLREAVPNKFSIGYLRDNIGYCLVLLGRYAEGIAELREALRLAEEVGNSRCVCECSHDLAFGLMQTRELPEAESRGERALKLAEKLGFKEITKNCYYILGEINHLKGNDARRDHYFTLLQTLHPNVPYIREFLCAFDVSKVIALRFPQ